MAILTGGSVASIKQVTSFPAGASEGDIVYHIGLQALFINVNDTGDTTNISAWEISSGKTSITEVPTTTQGTCDSISSTLYRTVKWVVSVTVGSKYTSFEVLANHDGIDVVFNEYSIIGDRTDYTVDVELGGGNILFKVTNNEATTMTVSVLRFSLI